MGAAGTGGRDGNPGSAGEPGRTGSPGTAGSPGAAGSQGVQGNVGPAGPQGPSGAAGPAGATGARGAAGADGQQGVQGNVGPAGPQGPGGAAGVPGAPGANGTTGDAGRTGATGPPGPRGDTGASGPSGPAGATGATGAAGQDGRNGLSQYGYIFNTDGETVPLEAAINFDANGVLTPGITHAPGATGVTLVETGDYKFTFSVSGVEPGQFALFVDGAVAPGAIYGSGAGTQQNTGQAILRLPAGTVVSLRNHTSAAAVTLQTLAGGTQANVNASLAIEKLSP